MQRKIIRKQITLKPETAPGLSIRKRVIAIDYGTKRIGLAQSDPLWLFAQPVGTFNQAELFKRLDTMFKEGDVEKIIVGYPLGDGGEQNAMTAVVDRFIEELRAAFPPLVVERLDEHHSSRDARTILVASGKSRKVRQQKGRIDSAAACVLLSQYLDNQSNAR